MKIDHEDDYGEGGWILPLLVAAMVLSFGGGYWALCRLLEWLL